MYPCDRCGGSIAVTTSDPLIWTKLGRMHHRCAKAAWFEKNRPKPRVPRAPRPAMPVPQVSSRNIPFSFGPLMNEVP